MEYEWDFAIVLRDYDLLLLGLLNTLKVTGLALLFGVPLGLVLALLRLYGNLPIRIPIGILIEFLRATPPIAQLFWFFFALPILIGIEMDPFKASVLTFSLQSSAFFAEVFRGGIVSIDKGQWEAAKAIGMNRNQTLNRIILPQAIKRMIPAFLERAIELMKTTTLVSTISYADLLYQANNIAQSTYRALEVFNHRCGHVFRRNFHLFNWRKTARALYGAHGRDDGALEEKHHGTQLGFLFCLCQQDLVANRTAKHGYSRRHMPRLGPVLWHFHRSCKIFTQSIAELASNGIC